MTELLTPPGPRSPRSLDTSLMIQLARKITEETEKLDQYFKSSGLPDLGFDVESPGDLPKLPDDIQKSRLEISSATKELELLVRGPRETVRWSIWNYLDTVSLQILNSYGIRMPIFLNSTYGHLTPSSKSRTFGQTYCPD